MPPEVVNGQIYNKSVDQWSFGCFMYEIAFGEPPFSSLENCDTENGIFDAILNIEVEGNDDRDPIFNEIMLAQMSKDVNGRMPMSEVLQHPYLQDSEQLLP